MASGLCFLGKKLRLKEKLEAKMITVKVATYALVDVLKALESKGITSCTITKEDDDLEIVLTSRDLRPFLSYQKIENYSKNA